MKRTPDMFDGWFDGWFDNQTTRCRELWSNGMRTRYGHRSAICPNAHHAVMRAPWGSYPNLPANASLPTEGRANAA